MACPFCATGQAGLTRNLSTGEIVEQVVAAQRTEAAVGGRVSNVVFMGMGEPLANYRRVVDAVRRITEPAPHGVGIGQRSVVVSTVGLVPAVDKLTEEGLQVTLALSLHAPDDELRDTLVPVNTRWPVREVLAAAFAYTRRTGRRLSIEYALIRDVNDQPWRADLLAKRLAGKLVHVNLIPLNPTPGSPWDASPQAAEQEFVRRLRAGGVNATVRDTRGRSRDRRCVRSAVGRGGVGPGCARLAERASGPAGRAPGRAVRRRRTGRPAARARPGRASRPACCGCRWRPAPTGRRPPRSPPAGSRSPCSPSTRTRGAGRDAADGLPRGARVGGLWVVS
jgi:23S rRNA (adenine2503-C2)-methyltransferase